MKSRKQTWAALLAAAALVSIPLVGTAGEILQTRALGIYNTDAGEAFSNWYDTNIVSAFPLMEFFPPEMGEFGIAYSYYFNLHSTTWHGCIGYKTADGLSSCSNHYGAPSNGCSYVDGTTCSSGGGGGDY